MLPRVVGVERLTAATALCLVYPVPGSIDYFAISTATLRRMYGETAYNRIVEEFPRELRSQIRRLIDGQMHAGTAGVVEAPAGAP